MSGRRPIPLAIPLALALVLAVGPARAQTVSDAAKADASRFLQQALDKASKSGAFESGRALGNDVRPQAVPVDPSAAARPLATMKGVDIDSLLARYQGKMPTRQQKESFGTLLVFVSFSIPPESLGPLVADTRKAGGMVVLRGLKDGSLKATALAIKALGKNARGMTINPRLFKMFDVEAVPAVVVSTGEAGPCLDKACVEKTGPFDKVSGNIPLADALERVAAKGELADTATRHLARLQGRGG